jgi:hypothetical protein
VFGALPKALHGKAKADLQAIRMGPTRREANQALKRFISRYGGTGPKATEQLAKNRAVLLAFPADPRVHLRTTNPIESTFATVCHRTGRTKNGVTRTTFLGLAFKLAEEAATTWRRIRAPETVAELLGGARYNDGSPVSDDPPQTQEEQREAARETLSPHGHTPDFKIAQPRMEDAVSLKQRSSGSSVEALEPELAFKDRATRSRSAPGRLRAPGSRLSARLLRSAARNSCRTDAA